MVKLGLFLILIVFLIVVFIFWMGSEGRNLFHRHVWRKLDYSEFKDDDGRVYAVRSIHECEVCGKLKTWQEKYK